MYDMRISYNQTPFEGYLAVAESTCSVVNFNSLTTHRELGGSQSLDASHLWSSSILWLRALNPYRLDLHPIIYVTYCFHTPDRMSCRFLPYRLNQPVLCWIQFPEALGWKYHCLQWLWHHQHDTHEAIHCLEMTDSPRGSTKTGFECEEKLLVCHSYRSVC